MGISIYPRQWVKKSFSEKVFQIFRSEYTEYLDVILFDEGVFLKSKLTSHPQKV